MKIKPHWLIYSGVVVATVGLAFYQHSHIQNNQSAKEKENLIFPSLELGQVRGITLKFKTGSMQFHYKKGAWFMESPVQDVADLDLVNDWLESLLSEKVQVIKEKEVDFSEYNLDKNVHSIELTSKSKQKFNIDISYYSAFDGQFYIKKGESLLLGDQVWAEVVGKQFSNFRSYKLLNRRDHPESLWYKSTSFSANLKWLNYLWKWNEEKKFPLSGTALESYWSTLSQVKFDKKILPNTREMRKKFKLLKPATEINFIFKDNKKWSAKISSRINNEFYVLVSDRDYIFILNEEQKRKTLLNMKILRDHRHAFQFELSQAVSLMLKGYGLDLELEKKKKKWSLVKGQLVAVKGESVVPAEQVKNEPLKSDDLNLEEASNILNRIKVLEAQEYFPAEKPFSKAANLEIRNKNKEVILSLEFSEPFEIKTDKTKRVYVKSNKNKEVMSLNFDHLKFIFSKALLIQNKNPL